jgi:hypothetical protein
MMPGDDGGEPPLSIAAEASRRFDRLEFVEIELDDDLQLLRQSRPFQAGRQSLPRRRPALSSQVRYSSWRSSSAATAVAQRWGRGGVRRAGGADGGWSCRRNRARRRACRWAGVMGRALRRGLGMFLLQRES